MSISEYFIPLTSTGVSLERKQEEKWWEQRARTGRSQQAIGHIWSLLWSQFDVTVWWQMLQMRSTARDLNQPSWGVEEEYNFGTRSAVTYSQGCNESTAFNISTRVSACTVCTFVYLCVCVCVCVFLLGEMSTQHLLTHRLLRQSKPELTGLQGNIFILVLSPLQHVLRQM